MRCNAMKGMVHAGQDRTCEAMRLSMVNGAWSLNSANRGTMEYALQKAEIWESMIRSSLKPTHESQLA